MKKTIPQEAGRQRLASVILSLKMEEDHEELGQDEQGRMEQCDVVALKYHPNLLCASPDCQLSALLAET